jgi:hypothetical protein
MVLRRITTGTPITRGRTGTRTKPEVAAAAARGC